MRDGSVENGWWSPPEITSSSIGSIRHHLCKFSIKVRSCFFVDLILFGITNKDDCFFFLFLVILIVVVFVMDQLWRNIANFFRCFVRIVLIAPIGSFFIGLGIVRVIRFMLRSEQLVGSRGSLGERSQSWRLGSECLSSSAHVVDSGLNSSPPWYH